jgi:hypothetical protein
LVGYLAGGPLLVEEEQREGGRLVVGLELEHRVEAATLLLKVTRLSGQPEAGPDDEDAGAPEAVDDERSQPGSESVDHWTVCASTELATVAEHA